MRRTLVVGLVLLVAAGLAVPALGEPSVRRDQEAYAEWFFPTDEPNERRWFGAFVFDETSLVDGGARWDIAVFVKGRCVRERHPDYIYVECTGRDFVRGDPDKHLTMSPLAIDAELVIRRDGRKHAVRWKAAPSTGHYFTSEYCFNAGKGGKEEQEGEGHGGGFAHEATASGNFLGRRFKKSPAFRGGLASGVVATTCPGRSVEYDRASGSIAVTYRIPR